MTIDKEQIKTDEEEVSLKELILQVQGITKYLISKWRIILLSALIGSCLGVIYALIKQPTYEAKLTFVLEDSKSSPLGAYAGIASQFGIDLGGGGSGAFSGDNMLELLKSRLIVEKALLSPLGNNHKEKTLADLYIDINNVRHSWENEPTLKNIHFPVNIPRSRFSLQQDSILFTLYDKIVEDALQVSKPDKKLNFISITCSSKDEFFSKRFTEQLAKEATDLYLQTKTQRSKNTVDKLQAKADSIEQLLNRKTYSVAASQDMNLNPARNMAGVTTELVARDKIVLQTIYSEVVKNLELSRMAMAQETPIIQIIDTPILPLEKKKVGIIKGIIIGGFIFGFLLVVILVIMRSYHQIMK